MKLARFLTLVSAAALAGPAIAADLPSRKEAPMMFAAPMPTWNGFYIGLNAGGVFGANRVSTSVAPFTASTAAQEDLALLTSALGSGSGNSGGFIGGGQIGYNYMITPSVLAGIEADIQGSSQRGSATFSGLAPVVPAGVGSNSIMSTIQSTSRLNWLATIRGRLGFTLTPAWLLYATGGLALGGVSSTANITQIGMTGGVNPPPSFGASWMSRTRAGWTIGAGAEWMFAQNWSAKLEYMYYDLGSASGSPTVTGFNFTPTGFPGLSLGSVLTTANTRYNGHIVRAGVNYHFNWDAPAMVVAKY